MILQDAVQIRSSPEKVWMFIEDPHRMKSWNPKIQQISSISWGARNLGYRYRITYVMSKKTSEFLAEIIEYRQPERLVIRLTEANLPTGSYVNEIYDLSRSSQGTLLKQTIQINNSGINILLRLVIGFISRFGKPTHQKHLEKLKDLVEASV